MRVGHDDHETLSAADLVAPLAGSSWWTVAASGAIPDMKLTDGPSGARGGRFSSSPPSVWFPCAAAFGATWDVELVERVGAALAVEVRAKGGHVLLAPTVNLQRSPLGGRHFECFSEDPVLTAELAVAYVTGLQRAGVSACVKHLIANDVEHDRFEVSAEPDERTLREVLLLPFERTLRGGAWAVMAAYNRLAGVHCSEHAWLLDTVLREEWGWDGVVVSDWFGTRSTVAAAQAGLDLEMPGPPLHWGSQLAAAVERGEVPLATVLAKRDRLARLGDRTGAAALPPARERAGGTPEVVALAREVAAAGIVLLRNEEVGGRGVLPLDPGVRRLAVLGPNADREVLGGGGSARVSPTAMTTVADGLRARFGGEVVVEAGCSASRGTPAIDRRQLRRADGTPGVDVEVVDAADEVVERFSVPNFRVVFLDQDGPVGDGGHQTVRASSAFLPAVDGMHRFKVRANGTVRLRIDGTDAPAERELRAGQPVSLVLEATMSLPSARLEAEVRCASHEPIDGFGRAVAAAEAADAAVVVVGLDGEWETEGRDRTDLLLPGPQADLIRAVAAVQPATVVAVIAGAPVDVSWAADVPGVLWCWYPGQEGGRAVADVLFGAVDPGGRLPCTIPSRLEQTPAFFDVPPASGVIRYAEGVFCGHRWYDATVVEPAYPFGFGLSYTAWEVGRPVLPSEVGAGSPIGVDVEVANVGDRAGSHVVQLYVGDPVASVRRPVRELRGFAKVRLDPGERRTVHIELTPRDLAFWDTRSGCWRAEAGQFLIWAGSSSRHLGEAVPFRLSEDWAAPAG